MSYKSQIRDSEMNMLLEKVAGKNYSKYLSEMNLVNIKGFKDQVIKFHFPVTAIIGPNGGGKTTVLGAAACAYKETKPGKYFPKCGKYDDSMQNWKISYKMIDKNISAKIEIERTAVFSNYKWTRDKLLSRNTLSFGVSRTIPATERRELKTFANGKFVMPHEKITKIKENVCDYVGKILNKDITDFSIIESAGNEKKNVLSGKTKQGYHYTEFHFGAGESSIIRMITEIEKCEDNSLILIEEIENGLHPLAVRRLVEYLINVSLRKRVQVLFTTHSNEALKPLPDQAIWVCNNGEISQGKLTIESLWALTGDIHAEMLIYVEDIFAQRWIEAVLSSDKSLIAGAIEVYAMEGDGKAVKTSKGRNEDPGAKYHSLCYINGDSDQKESEEQKIYRLPGEMPEPYVFLSVKERFDDISSKLTLALHQDINQQGFVKQVLEEVWRETYDKHTLFSSVAIRLGYMQEETVRSAFLHIWCDLYKDEKEIIYNNIMRNFAHEFDTHKTN